MARLIELEKIIIEMIEGKEFKSLKETLSSINPRLATLLKLSEKNILVLYRLLPKDLAADTFVEMDKEQQRTLIESFSDSELKEVINDLYIDDVVGIIEEMPANVVKRILKNATEDTRKQVNQILNYPQDSAGSIMTTEYVSLRSNMTIADAINRIRSVGVNSETFETCYVTDNVKRLIGYIDLRTIILADDTSTVGELMESNVISVNP